MTVNHGIRLTFLEIVPTTRRPDTVMLSKWTKKVITIEPICHRSWDTPRSKRGRRQSVGIFCQNTGNSDGTHGTYFMKLEHKHSCSTSMADALGVTRWYRKSAVKREAQEADKETCGQDETLVAGKPRTTSIQWLDHCAHHCGSASWRCSFLRVLAVGLCWIWRLASNAVNLCISTYQYHLSYVSKMTRELFGKAMLAASQIFNTVWLDSPQLRTVILYIHFLSGYKMNNTKKRPFCKLKFPRWHFKRSSSWFVKMKKKTHHSLRPSSIVFNTE